MYKKLIKIINYFNSLEEMGLNFIKINLKKKII